MDHEELHEHMKKWRAAPMLFITSTDAGGVSKMGMAFPATPIISPSYSQ